MHVRQQSTGEKYQSSLSHWETYLMSEVFKNRLKFMHDRRRNQNLMASIYLCPSFRWNYIPVRWLIVFHVILVQIRYVHVFYIYIILKFPITFHAHPFYTHTDTASKISDPCKSILIIWRTVVSSSILFTYIFPTRRRQARWT